MSVALDMLERSRRAQVPWAELEIAQRLEAIRGLRYAIVDRMDSLAEAICQDIGKAPLDAFGGDILVALEFFRHYEKTAASILKPRTLARDLLFFAGSQFHEEYSPLGSVLVIAPWNYPFQLGVVPALSALVAGNAVILKMSESAPRCTDELRRIVAKSGLAPDLLQIAEGGPVLGQSLIEARPDKVFFTGSTTNGAKVAARAAELLIPTDLELGGKDPMIIFADAPFERTIDGALYGAFSNSGQVCVAAKRIYVERSLYPRFLKEFSAKAASLRVGAPGAAPCADVDVGPLARETERLVLRAHVEDALARGACLHGEWSPDSRAWSPLILTEVDRNSRLLREESFGPVVCVFAFDTENEAIELANDSDFALSASVWSADLLRATRVASRVQGGSCAVNDVIRVIANPHAPFGGEKSSGWGRLHGAEGLLAFVRRKVVMVNSSRRKSEINWFPFRKKTLDQLKTLIRFRHGPGSFAKRMKDLILLAALSAAGISAPSARAESVGVSLELSVTGLKPQAGFLAYAVFRAKDGFPTDKSRAWRANFVPIHLDDSGSMNFTIEELPPGDYALVLYQDLNGNRKLDKNFLGIPREPVGASRNPSSRMGPPRYKDCRFAVDEHDLSLSIKMI